MERPKRSLKQVNYNEDRQSTELVEREIEWDEDDDLTTGAATRQVGKAKGGDDARTPGAVTGKKPKKQQLTAKQEKELKMQGALKNFKLLPTELVAEICTYLMPVDLLNLTRVSRMYYQFLTSTAGEFLWLAKRRLYGFPDLSPVPGEAIMSEERYARLLCERACDACASMKGTYLSILFRKRLCKYCKKAQFVNSRTAKDCVKELHISTLSCIPSRKNPTTYFMGDIVRVNDKLLDLEEQDSLDSENMQIASMRRAGTRSRGPLARETAPIELEVPFIPPASAVEEFVQQRKGAFQLRRAEGMAVEKAMKAYQAALAEAYDSDRQRKHETREREYRERQAAWAAKQAAKDPAVKAREEEKRQAQHEAWLAKRKQEAENIGFMRSKLSELGLDADYYLFLDSVIESINHISVVDEEAWSQIGSNVVAKYVADKQRRDVELERLKNRAKLRASFVRIFDSSLKDGSITHPEPLPEGRIFVDRPEILSIVDSALQASTFDEVLWNANTSKIGDAIDNYVEARRAHAIKLILSSTTNVSYHALDRDSKDYPEEEYDEAFFNLATSAMVCDITQEVPRNYRNYSRQRMPVKHTQQLLPFTEILKIDALNWNFENTTCLGRWEGCTFSLDPVESETVRAIIKVVKLNALTATCADLDEIGTAFDWRYRGKRHFSGTWKDIVRTVSAKLDDLSKVDLALFVPPEITYPSHQLSQERKKRRA